MTTMTTTSSSMETSSLSNDNDKKNIGIGGSSSSTSSSSTSTEAAAETSSSSSSSPSSPLHNINDNYDDNNCRRHSEVEEETEEAVTGNEEENETEQTSNKILLNHEEDMKKKEGEVTSIMVVQDDDHGNDKDDIEGMQNEIIPKEEIAASQCSSAPSSSPPSSALRPSSLLSSPSPPSSSSVPQQGVTATTSSPTPTDQQQSQQQLEERVQELEDKIATLSRLLQIQQQQQHSQQQSFHRSPVIDAINQTYAYNNNNHNYNNNYNSSYDYYNPNSNNNSTFQSITPPASPKLTTIMNDDGDDYGDNNDNDGFTPSKFMAEMSKVLMEDDNDPERRRLSSLQQQQQGSHGNNRQLYNYDYHHNRHRIKSLDGSMPVLESPAPTRRPTMDLLDAVVDTSSSHGSPLILDDDHDNGEHINHVVEGKNDKNDHDDDDDDNDSPVRSRNSSGRRGRNLDSDYGRGNDDKDNDNDYDQRDIIIGDIHGHSTDELSLFSSSPGGNVDDVHDGSGIGMKHHQRNLSYRVLHTNDFATTTVSLQKRSDDGNNNDNFDNADDANNNQEAVKLKNESNHVPTMELESVPKIDGASNMDMEILAPTTENHSATPASTLFLPAELSNSNEQRSRQSNPPSPELSTRMTASGDHSNSGRSSNPGVLRSSIPMRTKATINDVDVPSGIDHGMETDDHPAVDKSPDKLSRNSVASSTLSSPSKVGKGTSSPSPPPSKKKKNGIIQRERSLSYPISLNGETNQTTKRSSEHQSPPKTPSMNDDNKSKNKMSDVKMSTPAVATSNNSNNNSNSNNNIKSKWLDYLNSVQESNYDTDKQMEEFVKVPAAVEGLLGYGFWICVNSFLYTLTILPVKFVWSCLLLIRFCFLKLWMPTVPDDDFKFNRRHAYQLIQVSIIYTIYAIVLKPIDISIIYHWIRVQNMVKLYLLIAIVEVFDRLMCSLGQDCLDSLYWNTTRRPRSSRLIVSILVVLMYTALHSLLLFIHVSTLNVAVNSNDQALLSLLIGGNFAEIKSTVFKKYNKASLFKITASDVCERFKLGLFLVIVVSLNLSQGMERKLLVQYFRMCSIVWCAEWLSDWIKHSFITKFNYIASGVYSEYGLLLAGDVTGMGHEGLNLDSSHSVVKRLGLAQVPLVCVMFRYLRDTYKYATYEHPLPPWGVVTSFTLIWSVLLISKLSLGFFLHKISMRKLEAAPAFSKSAATVAKKRN